VLSTRGSVHHRDSVARQVGVPGTYDYGPQRTAWMCTLDHQLMGDSAFIKRLRADLRRFNVVGDNNLVPWEDREEVRELRSTPGWTLRSGPRTSATK